VADIVSEGQAAAPKRDEQALVLARRRAEANVPRHRFGLAYLLLAALLGAGVGLAVVFGTRHDSSPKTASTWSSWRPVATGTLGVREIGRHVASRYRLDRGGQLVGVVAGPLVVPSEQGLLPISAILITSGNAGVIQQRIDVEQPQAGVMYQMCGAGPGCTIPGTASDKRSQLLKREALELSLYTFHYLPEADNVLVFIPPLRTVTPQSPFYHRLVYLPRAALTTELGIPLNRALPPGTTTITPSRIPAAEGNAIDGLTEGRIFHYEFQQAPDQSVFVVLSPLP
jgi:hypothetical protein